MKPFEFNYAVENLINLIEMGSREKAKSQLYLIQERYEEVYRKLFQIEHEIDNSDMSEGVENIIRIVKS